MKAALVAPQFDVAGRLVRVVPHSGGNVNDTYLAIFRTTFSEERFILQRLNRNVFASPEAVMGNMKTVTEHAHRRLESEAHQADRIWQLPRVIPTKSGSDFMVDSDGDFWRAISLISSAHAYEQVQNIEHAHEAGFVLGQFQRIISDIPVDKLSDTLPGFHITSQYLEHMDEVVATPEGQQRLKSSTEAEHCYRFIQKRRDWADVLESAKARGELQDRPIHGDPKIANIMIDDETGKGTCMIDLDTVKPGLVHHDFGDCLRSCCNASGEETLDLSRVVFDTDLCEAIVRGYMTFARSFLTDADLHYQYDSIRLITFELGVRFFADFIAGNVYFKTQHEAQNLNRALVQLKLCESIETRESIIRKLLERLA
ncbi:MAG: aminoglycoside phosphotransferase family protein [Verrucomicrobia bacterium]|jgi:Ser/Thr protein kinase RdoA (MazF antagonist)|nr:aminoglycoside phosphotransferase family protein [Verrucomicrobiota bacterium]